ncbi:MAG: tyrosine-type recombinase/integrase [Sarcina sp.]
MAKTKHLKRTINNKEYYYSRIRHENLNGSKDLYAETIKELDEKIKIFKLELDNNVQSSKKLFISFFESWLFEVHFINKKASTKEKYEGLFRNYIKTYPNFKKLKLNNLDINVFQTFYNSLSLNGVSESIIKNIHKLIAPNIRYAFFNNLIIKDFSKALSIPNRCNAPKKSNVIPFSLDEQFRFIAAIKGHDLETLYLTALNTGLRQGELFALQWSDLDFESNLITVNKSVKGITHVSNKGRESSEVIIQTTKTEKSNRYVPMPQFLKNKLLEHKIIIEEQKKNMSNLYTDLDLVFPNKFGKYLNPSNVRKRFKKILNQNNLKDIKFHDLRHTFATRLFEVGEEPKVIQELLGHSNISLTLDTYTHVLDKLKVKAVSKLDSLYANI